MRIRNLDKARKARWDNWITYKSAFGHFDEWFRFWEKVDKTQDCWLWTAAPTSQGYGSFYRIDRSRVYAHVFAFLTCKGPIAEGLELDHLCRNPLCVRPDHLEAVTHRENVLRGIGLTAQNAAKTHCKNGHELTPENLSTPHKNQPVARLCRACRRIKSAKRRERERKLCVNCEHPFSDHGADGCEHERRIHVDGIEIDGVCGCGDCVAGEEPL